MKDLLGEEEEQSEESEEREMTESDSGEQSREKNDLDSIEPNVSPTPIRIMLVPCELDCDMNRFYLFKHKPGAEHTGNEKMDEENFYYLAALSCEFPRIKF